MNHFKEHMSDADASPIREGSMSSRLFQRLQKRAAEEGVVCSMLHAGSPIEVLIHGGSQVLLRHFLQNANRDVSGGIIETCAESWEYRKFPWWKEVLDAEESPVRLLDTPVVLAARDTQLPDADKIFRPSLAASSFKLYDTTARDSRDRIFAERWIQMQIEDVLYPLLAPHFTVKYLDDALRLLPITADARESVRTENDTYRQTLQKITEAVPILEKRYRQGVPWNQK